MSKTGPEVESMLSGMEYANFFENRATEYSKASMTGTWDDAFSIHDTAKAAAD